MSDFAVAIEVGSAPAKRRPLSHRTRRMQSTRLFGIARSHHAGRPAGDATLDRSVSQPSPALTGGCIATAKVLHPYLVRLLLGDPLRKRLRSKSAMA
jgi:hypothetical protein